MPVFQAFSNLVRNDFLHGGALGKGKGGKAAIKLMEERGVDPDALLDGWCSPELRQQYEYSMAAYNYDFSVNYGLSLFLRARSIAQYLSNN